MQINLRPTFKNICFNGSYFWLMFLCSAQQISTFLTVSPSYFSPHIHSPLHVLQDQCKFLSFTLNNDVTICYIHFITISYFSFLNWWSFLMKCFDAVLFVSKNGTSINKMLSFHQDTSLWQILWHYWYYDRYIIFRRLKLFIILLIKGIG